MATSTDSQSAYLYGRVTVPSHYLKDGQKDDFDRADVGSSWTIVEGTVGITSNRLTCSVAEAKLYWNASAFSPDQYSEAKQYNSGWRGVTVRNSGTVAGGGHQAYVLYLSGAGTSTYTLRIGWQGPTDAGWGAYLDTTSSITIYPGSVLRFEAIGQDQNIILSAYVNGVLVKTLPWSSFSNPAAIINSGSPGLYFNTTAPAFDDWAGGDLPKWYLHSYIKGGTRVTDSQAAYLNAGGPIVTDSQPAYIVGAGNASEDSQTAYLKGKTTGTDSQSAFMRGTLYGQIIHIRHEAGDLSEYDGYELDGGDVSVSAAAGMAHSNYGLAILNDDSNNKFAYKNVSPTVTGGVIGARFYINLSTLSGSYDAAGVFGLSIFNDGFQYFADIYAVIGPSTHQLRPSLWDDFAVIHYGNQVNVGVGEHYIETRILRSSTSSASDGRMETWIDGAIVDTISGVDNYDKFYQFGRVPMGLWYANATTTGTMYLDELVVRADGKYIGPVPWDSQPGYIKGRSSATDQQLAYLEGTSGSAAEATDSLSAYLRGRQTIPNPNAIVDIHLNADLSEFTSTVTDGDDLAWSNDATARAVAGTAGAMSCLLDDTTAIYGQKNFNKSTTVRLRFYIDPNTLTMATGDSFIVFRFAQVSSGLPIFNVNLARTATSYRFQASAYNDAGASACGSDIIDITDAPHYVEFLGVQAATDVSSDGSYQIWVDGVSKDADTGIDNYNRMNDQNWRIRVGALEGIDAGTSGTFYIDEIAVNDSGVEIGPVSWIRAYLKGKAAGTDNQPAFIDGATAENEATDSQPAYLVGADYQYQYPDEDIGKVGGWKNELGGSTLYMSLDETDSPDDNDYVWSDIVQVDDYFEISLAAAEYIIAEGSVTIQWRGKMIAGGGCTLKVELREGETVRASSQQVFGDAYETYSYTLTEEERDSIVSWGSLSLRFTVMEVPE